MPQHHWDTPQIRFEVFKPQRGSLIWWEFHWMWVRGECVWRPANHLGVLPSSLSATSLLTSNFFQDKLPQIKSITGHLSSGTVHCLLQQKEAWRDMLVAEYLLTHASDLPMAWPENSGSCMASLCLSFPKQRQRYLPQVEMGYINDKVLDTPHEASRGAKLWAYQYSDKVFWFALPHRLLQRTWGLSEKNDHREKNKLASSLLPGTPGDGSW